MSPCGRTVAVALVVATGLMLAGRAVTTAQQPVRRAAEPLDPITAILGAFETHPLVALGEGSHGNEQGHALRLRLIRDPRFAATVNDIVVEFGSARYQVVRRHAVSGSCSGIRRLTGTRSSPSRMWSSRRRLGIGLQRA
jgi:hypothetical protein